MSIHRCDLLCVRLEAEVETSQIQRHLSTVHLNSYVRCSLHRYTTYPQRLHLNYVQSLKDVVSSRVVSDEAGINSGSDGGSVDEHQCCLVSSLSSAYNLPHPVDDWLTFLATYLIWRFHVIRLSRTIPRNFVYSTKLSSAFPSLMFVLMEYHSGLVCGLVEAPLITPVFYLLDRGLHLFCDDLKAPSGPPYGAVVHIGPFFHPFSIPGKSLIAIGTEWGLLPIPGECHFPVDV